MKKGIFVVFEGPDGVGKDTMIDMVKKQLKRDGVDFVTVQDPSQEVASEIRAKLLSDKTLTKAARLYLYLAARSELLNKQIVPALLAGKVVICNRYALSTYAYQGIDFSDDDIATASRIAGLDQVTPDLQIVYLKGRSYRTLSEEDAMGQFCHDFRDRIVANYVRLAKNPAFNARVIWADGLTIDEQFEKTQDLLREVLAS